MKKKNTCDSCGTECDRESEGLWAEGYDNVCRECYDEIVKTCQLCDSDDVMPSDVSEYILVKTEFAPSHPAKPPGIYRILSRPFMMSCIIGTDSLFSNDVLFIDKLPKRDSEYEISGHICKECAKPYMSVYMNAYRYRPDLEPIMADYSGCKDRTERWHALLQYTRQGWIIQREHTRKVIMDNREMLRDLECDADDSDWTDLQELYELPKLPTYHEWLFLEHKGVRVFRRYDHDSAWLTLRPEPLYRNQYYRDNDCVIFDASDLPTWPRQVYQSWSYSYGHDDPDRSRQAVIDAIEHGIITPTKITKDKGRCG